MSDRRRRFAAGLALVAGIHSLLVGAAMLLAPGLLLRLGGWEPFDDVFFVLQGGAFHVVLGLGYLLEWRFCGRLRLLILAKACAVVFLAGVLVLADAPPAVRLALPGDALFLAAAFALDPRPGRGGQSRSASS